jgi:hypothetical protein
MSLVQFAAPDVMEVPRQDFAQRFRTHGCHYHRVVDGSDGGVGDYAHVFQLCGWPEAEEVKNGEAQ